MLTIYGFIEQENWMYAFNFEEGPGIHSTSLFNSIPISDHQLYFSASKQDIGDAMRALKQDMYKFPYEEPT